MALARVTRVATATSTGNQDIRIAGMTDTPNAALFIASYADANNGNRSHGILSVGAATAVGDEWCVSVSCQDNVNPSNTDRRIFDNCFGLLNHAGNIYSSADFVEFLADPGSGAGVRINWTSAPASILLTVVLFVVDNAKAGYYNSSSTVDGITAVNTGFEPTLLIGSGTGQSSIENKNSVAKMSLGFAINSTPITQSNVSIKWNNGASSSVSEARHDGSHFVTNLNNAAAINWRSEITAFSATGFTETIRDSGSGDLICYLALDTGNTDIWMDTIATPIATGNDSVTGVWFPT